MKTETEIAPEIIQEQGKCPRCGSENINYDGGMEIGYMEDAYYKGVCEDCGCRFDEYYLLQYTGSEINEE